MLRTIHCRQIYQGVLTTHPFFCTFGIVKQNDWLSILYKHHKEWVAMVRGFGESIYAEDIVQEMYLRLHRYGDSNKFITNGNVNKGFIWMVLKNYYTTYQTQKSKHTKVNLDAIKELQDDFTDSEYHLSRDVIAYKIEAEINNWNWYDQKVYMIIAREGKSMRQFSRESKISTDSLFNTMKRCKERLRNAVGEDYDDLMNGDYSHIINNLKDK